MKKILLIIFLTLVLIIGCTYEVTDDKELSELQVTACETADEKGTCDTRLVEVGIVLKEDCCKHLGRCC